MENNYKSVKKFERIIAFSMLFFVVLVVVAIASFVKLNNARRANAEYNEMIASLELEKQSINSSIENMSSDSYLENQARNHLGMLKDGEIGIIFEKE